MAETQTWSKATSEHIPTAVADSTMYVDNLRTEKRDERKSDMILETEVETIPDMDGWTEDSSSIKPENISNANIFFKPPPGFFVNLQEQIQLDFEPNDELDISSSDAESIDEVEAEEL